MVYIEDFEEHEEELEEIGFTIDDLCIINGYEAILLMEIIRLRKRVSELEERSNSNVK